MTAGPSAADLRAVAVAKLKRAANLPRMEDGRRPPMCDDAIVSEGDKGVVNPEEENAVGIEDEPPPRGRETPSKKRRGRSRSRSHSRGSNDFKEAKADLFRPSDSSPEEPPPIPFFQPTLSSPIPSPHPFLGQVAPSPPTLESLREGLLRSNSARQMAMHKLTGGRDSPTTPPPFKALGRSNTVAGVGRSAARNTMFRNLEKRTPLKDGGESELTSDTDDAPPKKSPSIATSNGAASSKRASPAMSNVIDDRDLPDSPTASSYDTPSLQAGAPALTSAERKHQETLAKLTGDGPFEYDSPSRRPQPSLFGPQHAVLVEDDEDDDHSEAPQPSSVTFNSSSDEPARATARTYKASEFSSTSSMTSNLDAERVPLFLQEEGQKSPYAEDSFGVTVTPIGTPLRVGGDMTGDGVVYGPPGEMSRKEASTLLLEKGVELKLSWIGKSDQSGLANGQTLLQLPHPGALQSSSTSLPSLATSVVPPPRGGRLPMPPISPADLAKYTNPKLMPLLGIVRLEEALRTRTGKLSTGATSDAVPGTVPNARINSPEPGLTRRSSDSKLLARSVAEGPRPGVDETEHEDGHSTQAYIDLVPLLPARSPTPNANSSAKNSLPQTKEAALRWIQHRREGKASGDHTNGTISDSNTIPPRPRRKIPLSDLLGDLLASVCGNDSGTESDDRSFAGTPRPSSRRRVLEQLRKLAGSPTESAPVYSSSSSSPRSEKTSERISLDRVSYERPSLDDAIDLSRRLNGHVSAASTSSMSNISEKLFPTTPAFQTTPPLNLSHPPNPSSTASKLSMFGSPEFAAPPKSSAMPGISEAASLTLDETRDSGTHVIPPSLPDVCGLGGRSIDSLRGNEAAEIGSKLNSYLRNSSLNPTEYTATLKLLQDLCSISGEIPSSYYLKNVTVDRRDMVGRGGEAIIYGGDFNGRRIVVRQVAPPRKGFWRSLDGQRVIKLLHREAITHAQLEHPNIIPFLGVYRENTDEPPMTVLPFIERGSLGDVIREKAIFGVEFVCIMTGIGLALAYLHSRTPPIFHGDLHPDNILVGSPNNAFLCDFGLSRIRHECTRTHTIIREGGRTRFLAPELSDGPEEFRTSAASDIFSLAMTFLNSWTREHPFAEFKEQKAGAAIRDGRRPERPAMHIDLPSEIEEEFWQLIKSMWVHAADDRPSSQDVQKRLETIFGPILDQRKAVAS